VNQRKNYSAKLKKGLFLTNGEAKKRSGEQRENKSRAVLLAEKKKLISIGVVNSRSAQNRLKPRSIG